MKPADILSKLKNAKPWLLPTGAVAAGMGTALGGKAYYQSQNKDNTKRVILHLLGTGALAGTGVAGLQALSQHMELLKSQGDKEKERDKALNTEALVKSSAAPGWTGTSVGLLAALLGGVGSHHLVQKAYQGVRQKELEKMLADAEQGHTEALLREHDAMAKKASGGSPIRLQELLMPLMLASIPATALASAYGVKRLMDKAFNEEDMTQAEPTPVFEDQIPAALLTQKKERKKMARWVSDHDNFRQMMLDTAVAMPGAGELRDFVSVSSAGGLPELETMTMRDGFSKTAAAIRGAGSRRPPADDYAVGSLLLLKSAVLRDSLDILVAAEIDNAAPGMVKLAGSLDAQAGEWLCKLASLLADSYRLVRCGLGDDLVCRSDTGGLVKQAAVVDPQLAGQDPALLLQQLLRNKGVPQQEGDGQDLASKSQDTGRSNLDVADTGEDSDPNAVMADDAETGPSQDPVDAVFG